MKFHFINIIFLFTLFGSLRAQVVINEVCSANDFVIKDDEGDFEDWIELYNKSNYPVNLYNYSITKFTDRPEKWYFPGILINPKSHLTVFASGEDRKSPIDHWEVPIYPQLIWKYFVGASEPDPQWLLPGFNDAAWASGMGGIGYGDGDDSTIIPATTSLYMRKSIFIADTSRISIGILFVDYDDGFVAYLNGVEIARSNVGAYGDHPVFDQPAYEEHEAQLYQGGNMEGFFVPEKVMGSALVAGNNVFTIQTHNVSATSSDMSSIPYFILGISDTTVVFYPLPNESFALHTNFTLPSEGCKLTLKDAYENTIDEKVIEEIQLNHSRGRSPDGADSWCLFDTPTPNDTNIFSV
ncbi:MAG: lamin tail domain-containing protein, partial [Bacteroidales bacterium]